MTSDETSELWNTTLISTLEAAKGSQNSKNPPEPPMVSEKPPVGKVMMEMEMGKKQVFLFGCLQVVGFDWKKSRPHNATTKMMVEVMLIW